jgi:hypothetical protein
MIFLFRKINIKMDKFELNDIRSFCLCEIRDNFYYRTILKGEGYIPKYVRVYLWKILKASEILKLCPNENVREWMDELYVSSPTSLTLEKRQSLAELILPLHKSLKKYTQKHYNNSKVYDNLTTNGMLKDEISQALRQAGAHSWLSYISPVTEKIWVQSELSFDDFLERLPNELKDPNIWNFSTCSKPLICEE